MEVKTCFPFKICERCEIISLKVEHKDLYTDDQLYDRTIFIGCENSDICIKISNFLEKSNKEE